MLTWCVCVLREKKAACAPFLYDRNILTTATILMTLTLCGLISVFIWHVDIRARRIWVHGIIHRRQNIVNMITLARNKKKSNDDTTNTNLKSWYFNSKCLEQLHSEKRCWALHLFLGCLPAAADACSSLETKAKRSWTSEKNAIPTQALKLLTHTYWYESAISLLIWFFGIKGKSPFPKVLGCCFKWDNSCTKWKYV